MQDLKPNASKLFSSSPPQSPKMKVVSLVLFLLAIVATSQGSILDDVASESSILKEDAHDIHHLRPKLATPGKHLEGVHCSSWRLGVEAHNLRDWKTVPKECEDYMGHYMLGHQYRQDSKVVCEEAYKYATSRPIPKDGRTIWIFDIDETTLSNLPYYAKHGFGVEPYNATLFDKWVLKGVAPAVPETLILYRKIIRLGIKPVFLAGRAEDKRDATVKNLFRVGYYNNEKLILRTSENAGLTAVEYKSAVRKQLTDTGYRILGNIGDQWSDLLGTPTGDRTFKLPDPLYYIA